MVNQVITVNRRKYAAGLFWQPLAAGWDARSYARSLSHSVDGKLNLYVDYRSMVGLGSRRGGLRRGMHSAAAEILDSMTEYASFLGVFQAGTRYYLVAVRNGIILQDKLFDNADDARNEYVKLTQIPDWSALFAPESWSMPRAVERGLRDVITGRAPAVMRPISRIRTLMGPVLLFWVFALLLLYMFRGPISQMMQPRPRISTIDPELAAEYKRQIEEKSKELDAVFNIEKPAEPEPLRMPFDYLPNVDARAAVCYRAMAFLMQPIPGWNQVRVECGEEYATADFRRSFGTITDFYAIAGDKMPGGVVLNETDNSLMVRARLPIVETVASRDERDADTIVRDVTGMFQSIDENATIGVVADTVSNGVQTAVMEIVEIAASSKLIPTQFMEMFKDFGGVYMTKCSWNASQRTWNYEVIIYAK